MQPTTTTTIDRSAPKRHSFSALIVWASLALLLAGQSIIEMWGTWGLQNKATALLLLAEGPARLFWNRRSGKGVDFRQQAYTGYIATVLAVLVFAHRG